MAVFDGRAVEERTPQDFYEWAQEIAEYMWQAYQRDLQALNDEHGSSGSSSSASEANDPDEVQAAHDPDEVQAEVPEALVNAQGRDQGRDVQPVDQVEQLWAEGMNVIYLRLRAMGQGREAFQRLREGLRPQRTGVQISACRTIPTILNRDEDVAHVGRAGEAPTLMTVEEWVESVLRGWVQRADSDGESPGVASTDAGSSQAVLPYGLFHAAQVWPGGAYNTVLDEEHRLH